MSDLRAVVLVAWFDLQESLRSWRALAIIFLYLLGAMAATAIFVQILLEIERTLASSLQVAVTDRPGAMTQSLMESEQLLEILSGLVGDPRLARELIGTPPVALFYGWLSMAFVPILVTLTSAESIASALANGRCRYSLFRVERLAWVTGKLLGQSLLMVTGILVGAVGVWVIGRLRMNDFAGLETAIWLLRFSGRAAVYGFAFLGVNMGLSQMTRSVSGARVLSLLALLLLALGGPILSTPLLDFLGPHVVDAARQIFPNTHKLSLWQPSLQPRAAATMMLLALGGLAFSIGHQVMARRDA